MFKKFSISLTMLKRWEENNPETINVVTHEAEIAKYVLTIALIWPSSVAVAELNEGQ